MTEQELAEQITGNQDLDGVREYAADKLAEFYQENPDEFAAALADNGYPPYPPLAHSDATDQACDGMPPVSSCTPGPWGCQHGGNICRIWGVGSAPLNFPVATCSRVEGESVDTHQANAQLIADACNSYQKNCGPRAAECARDDLLGEALDVCEAMVAALESVVPTMVVRAAIHYGEALLGKAKTEGGAT